MSLFDHDDGPAPMDEFDESQDTRWARAAKAYEAIRAVGEAAERRRILHATEPEDRHQGNDGGQHHLTAPASQYPDSLPAGHWPAPHPPGCICDSCAYMQNLTAESPVAIVGRQALDPYQDDELDSARRKASYRKEKAARAGLTIPLNGADAVRMLDAMGIGGVGHEPGYPS